MNLIFRLTVSIFYLLCGTTIVSPTLHSYSEEHKNSCLRLHSVCIYAPTMQRSQLPRAHDGLGA